MPPAGPGDVQDVLAFAGVDGLEQMSYSVTCT
ncbi:hypothetical protein HD596_008877 [Nonomuraea jabiensis]|uniref:Uncharacterized protein n=1 Tax=Nonomuraea jabiensis TaxID=882448 RepID=A0A7W9GEI3_9ACTN|nr:hypothetical protein [Nonomuraea jabiensis]